MATADRDKPMNTRSGEFALRQLRIRLPSGSRVLEIPNLASMMQLMACLEAINSALRWLEYAEGETAPVRQLDKFMIWNAGAGWCAESFRVLKRLNAEKLIDPSVLSSKPQQWALWQRVTTEKPDAFISRMYRIRDKHFGHFDRDVMQKFVDWQDTVGGREPFFVGDETGKSLCCRWLWPTAALILDIFPDPSAPDRSEKIDEFLDGLGEIWAQTANMLMTLLEAWLVKCGLAYDSSDWDGHQA